MTRILHRRGTGAEWSAADPILAAGELGFETDTGRHKIGDGARAWAALPYFLPEDALTTWADARARRLDRVTPIRVPRRASRVLTDTASGFQDWYAEGEIDHVADHKSGTGSVRVRTPQATSAVANALRLFAAVDLSAHHLKLWVRVDRWSDLGGSQIRLHTTETAYFYAHLGAGLSRTARIDGEWTELVLPRSAFAANAQSPTWDTITCLALTAWSPAGTSVELLANHAVLVPDAPSPGVVSLSFDDGWASQYRAAQLMDAHGWAGTAYVIHHKLDAAGFLTTAQVDDLHDRGWDIGGHDDVPLRSLGDEQLRARLSANAQWLRERNYRGRHHYAYPNGSVDDRVVETVRQYFATGRTINPVNQSLSWVSEHRLSGVSVYADQDEAELRAMVDAAVADGEWANIVFHKIGDDGDDISWTETRFRAFLDYVAASGAVVQPLGGVL